MHLEDMHALVGKCNVAVAASLDGEECKSCLLKKIPVQRQGMLPQKRGSEKCPGHQLLQRLNTEPRPSQPTYAGHPVTLSTVPLVDTHQELGQPQEVAAAATERTEPRGRGSQKRLSGE